MAHSIRHIDTAPPAVARHEGGPLSSHEILPHGVHFETQNPYETIFVLLRPHLLTNLGWVITSAISIVIPLVIIYLTEQFAVRLDDFVEPIKQMVILSIYYSFVLTYIVFNFLDWYYDIYLVTNQRVVDYEFKPITSYKVFEVALEDIQDIRSKTVGFLPSIFNYGDVVISSAAETGSFKFHAVPRPNKFRDIIGDLSYKVRTEGHAKPHNLDKPNP